MSVAVILKNGERGYVRIMDRADACRLAVFDEAVNDNIPDIDNPFFIKKDGDWYRDFIKRGNDVIGLFSEKNELVAKAGLVLNEKDIARCGVHPSSRIYRDLRKEFQAAGRAALLTVVGTHPDHQRKGANRALLRAVFSHARDNKGKAIITALAAPRNMASLKLLSDSGMAFEELNKHSGNHVDYLYCRGDLSSILDDDHPYVPQAAVKNLAENVTDIGKLVACKAPEIIVSYDIADRYAPCPYNAPDMPVILEAFNQGYKGVSFIPPVNENASYQMVMRRSLRK